MKLGKFSMTKKGFHFNEGGNYLTFSVMRLTYGTMIRLWVHGHEFSATLRHQHNRVLSRKEARERIGGA